MASYIVDTEDGRYETDPDASKLAELISQLNTSDNTFLVVLPDTDTPTWHASVTTTTDGYLIERHTPSTGDDNYTTTDPQTISTDLKTWIDQRPDF